MTRIKAKLPHGISRRQFLLLATGTAVVAGLYIKRHHVKLLLPDQRRREKLLRLISHHNYAHNVGNVYVALRASEKSLGSLLDAIQQDLGVDPLKLKQTELATRITNLKRSDFRRQRVVDVGGWILSVTEARLAALTAVR